MLALGTPCNVILYCFGVDLAFAHALQLVDIHLLLMQVIQKF